MTLITGASSGIGAGTSILFAKLGALLALNGRDLENLNKVAQKCRDCGAAEVCDKYTVVSSIFVILETGSYVSIPTFNRAFQCNFVVMCLKNLFLTMQMNFNMDRNVY